MLRKLLRWQLIPIVLVLIVGFVLGYKVTRVEAANCNPSNQQYYDRCTYRGYFTNLNWTYPDALDPKVAYPLEGFRVLGSTADITNANQFINRIKNWLNRDFSGCQGPGVPRTLGDHDGNPKTADIWMSIPYDSWPQCYKNKSDSVGAAFIIATMMGKNGPEFGVPNGSTNWAGAINGVNWAKANVGAWEDRVREYDNRNLVIWPNEAGSWQCYGPNWGRTNHNTSGTMRHGQDAVMIWNTGNYCEHSIVFNNPDGSHYYIKTTCTNVTGAVQGLSDFRNDGTLSTATPFVEPGKSYTINAQLATTGGLSSTNPTFLLVQNQANAYVTHNSMTANGPNQLYNYYDGNVPSGGCSSFTSTPCWVWAYSSHASGAVTVNTFNITINSNVSDGQQLCFLIHAYKASLSSNTWRQGNQLCLTVRIPREPYLQTERGSIQAGADWGSAPCLVSSATTGDIRVRQPRSVGSKGDYIVSAGGNIAQNNFGSAGSINPPTSNSLKFGFNSGNYGQYGRVCRPDLAKQLLNDDPVPAVVPSPPASVDQILANNANGIYSYSGDLTLAGGTIGLNRRVTLVVKGNVTITSNILFDTAGYSGISSIPSFGIIATGNINIGSGVTSLYGLYYAGTDTDNLSNWNNVTPPALSAAEGLINTCQNSNVGTNTPNLASAAEAAQCGQALRVDGALVANNIYFRRTFGDTNAGSAPAETISYIPQLLLRPPDGFAGLAQQIRSNGERPPVF